VTIPIEHETLIGILLIDVESKDQLGLIRFLPEGVLAYQLITDSLHVYAFRNSVEGAVKKWVGEPLYVKYKHVLEEKQKIPDHILEQEAEGCANFLNAYEKPLNMGRYIVKAVKIPIRTRETKENRS